MLMICLYYDKIYGGQANTYYSSNYALYNKVEVVLLHLQVKKNVWTACVTFWPAVGKSLETNMWSVFDKEWQTDPVPTHQPKATFGVLLAFVAFKISIIFLHGSSIDLSQIFYWIFSGSFCNDFAIWWTRRLTCRTWGRNLYSVATGKLGV